MVTTLLPIFAQAQEALITWTPITFYATCAIIDAIIIVVAFRLLQIDAEYNTFVGGIIAAVIFNVVAYFTRSYSLAAVMSVLGVMFVTLLLISGGDAVKGLVVTFLCIVAYGGIGKFIIDRTPLTKEEIGGVPLVVLNGGLEAEPMTDEDSKEIWEAGDKATNVGK